MSLYLDKNGKKIESRLSIQVSHPYLTGVGFHKKPILPYFCFLLFLVCIKDLSKHKIAWYRGLWSEVGRIMGSFKHLDFPDRKVIVIENWSFPSVELVLALWLHKKTGKSFVQQYTVIHNYTHFWVIADACFNVRIRPITTPKWCLTWANIYWVHPEPC